MAFELQINTLEGFTIYLSVEPSATILEVKAQIFEKYGIPIAQQRLVLGKETDDAKTLADYGLSSKTSFRDCLTLVRCFRGSDNNQKKETASTPSIDQVLERFAGRMDDLQEELREAYEEVLGQIKEYDEIYLQVRLSDLDEFIRSYDFNRGNTLLRPFAKGRTPAAKDMCAVISDDSKDVFEKWVEIFRIGIESDHRQTENRSPETALFYSYFRSVKGLFNLLDPQNYWEINPENTREPTSIRADIMARSKGLLNSIDPESIFKMGESFAECGNLLAKYVETGSCKNLYIAFCIIFNQLPDFDRNFFHIEEIEQNELLSERDQNFVEVFRETIECLADTGLVKDTQIESLNTIFSLVETEIEARTAYDQEEARDEKNALINNS